MMRILLASTALAAAIVAAAVSAQTPTLKLNAPPLANALGEPVAKTWTTWQDQQRRALAKIKPPVGDVQEPELGVNLDKVPASVASNFDVASMLVPSWGTGQIAVSGAAEGVGAFRFNCNPGQIRRDDPIVFPKQPGKSHLHQFFGNLTADANSTYASLRAKGDSTCGNPLNRSAYWSPAMLDGKGNVIQWDYAQIYYKRSPSSSEGCAVVVARCEGIPRGLRQIFGYDMVTGKTPTGSVSWKCDGPTAPSGAFPTLADVAKVCRPGNYITVSSSSPTCWDGKRLDSPNHRDHLAYADFGNTGKLRCPATHPVGIPSFSLQLFYRVVDGDNPTEWYLSSDDMTAMGMGKLPAGTSFHTDFMDAWDDGIKHIWTDNCIDKMLSCNGGDLGNGKQLKDVWGFKWKIERHLVPIPPAS